MMLSKVATRALRCFSRGACSASYSLLTFVLGLALLFPPLLLGFVFGHALFVLGLPLRGLFDRFRFGSGCHGRRRFHRFARLMVGMYRTFIVEADRHRSADILSKHDDGGFGAGARWLGVGIVRFCELAVLVFL
jgi:hypothetical protein